MEEYKFRDREEGKKILNRLGYEVSPFWQVIPKLLPEEYPYGGQFGTMPVPIASLMQDGSFKLLSHESPIVARYRKKLGEELERIVSSNGPSTADSSSSLK